MESLVPALLLVLIFIYSFFVVRRKIKKMKKGEFCCSGCGECPSAKKCNKTYK